MCSSVIHPHEKSWKRWLLPMCQANYQFCPEPEFQCLGLGWPGGTFSPLFLHLCLLLLRKMRMSLLSCFSTINPGFSFAGSLLGTDSRLFGWNFPYDYRVCLWNWKLHGAQQLPHDHLWGPLFVLRHHPLLCLYYHHPDRLLPHQAHSRRAREYPFELTPSCSTSL